MKNTDTIIERIVSENTRELLREAEAALPLHSRLQTCLLELRLLVDRGIEQLRQRGPQPLY
jgi:hypothetical protein